MSTTPAIRILDTNIILRLLVQDVPAQTQQAVKLFKSAKQHSLLLPEVVVIEAAYVMDKLYNLNRSAIGQALSFVIHHQAVISDASVWNTALTIYQEDSAVSITDAYLCALSSLRKEALLTFDKRLARHTKVDDLAG